MSRPADLPKLNRRRLLPLVAGLALCGFGYLLAHGDAPEVRTVLATAGGCNMPTDVYEPRSGSPLGSVVLLHGLFANKKVMLFTAQEFANQDLRVFVPDLPGHGKAPGPFSPERTELCALALVRDLAARKAIVPARTLLAGHSMGGAIATRVAAQIPVAGVIAISPAPMQPSKDVPAELLLFPSHPPLAPHSLVLSAAWEPAPIRQIASELVSQSGDSSNEYAVIPKTSHVSILFAPATFDALRNWTSRLLGTSSSASFPASHPALGCLFGLFGLTLLVPPFLHEITPQTARTTSVNTSTWVRPAFLSAILIVVALSFAAVAVLRFVNFFQFLRIFQGGYFASLLFTVGMAALILQRQVWSRSHQFFTSTTLAACATALVVLLLFGAWFELTFYEGWLTVARWLRLPVLFLAFLPWHLGEELLLGSPPRSPSLQRLALALALRAIVWLSAVAAVFYLHSGQFVFLLLFGYFAAFSILQRLAVDAVRVRTSSLSAAAVFGAILLAGFVLAILPVA